MAVKDGKQEDVVEDVDEEPQVQAWRMDRGPNREDMVDSFLPDKEDWGAKTLLELNNPAQVSALRQFGTIFPEVEDLQPTIDDFLDVFLRTRTSVGGQSRDDIKSILMAMYGSRNEEDRNIGRAFRDLLAADVEDD